MFISELKSRGLQVEHCGWGTSGVQLTKSELIAKIQNCKVAFTELEDFDKEVIEASSLEFIGVARGNPVNIDLQVCNERGITVVTTPARNADSVADFCVAMILNTSRRLNFGSNHLRESGWNFEGFLPYREFRGVELGSLKIGLYGLGNIGRRLAHRLKEGFGSKLYYFDPFVEDCMNAEKVSTLQELFEICDVISIHAPLNGSTINSVTEKEIRLLGNSGILINSARAQLVDENALYNALARKELHSAALDVFWEEPLQPNSKWLNLPNVILTPHIAGASLNVISNQCEILLSGLDKWTMAMKGDMLIHE